MKKIFSLTILLYSCCLFSNTQDYSIIFIHLGASIPSYITHAIKQAKLFNKKCNIYLLTDNTSILASIEKIPEANIINIAKIPISAYYKEFEQKTTLDKNSREGFWLNASKRFLVLHDFIKHRKLTNVFHIEYDTMLYANLEELMPIFTKNYPNMAAVFDNDDRCIPCFVYIKDELSSEKIAACFTKNAVSGKNDMEILAILKKEFPSFISNLPIITPDYINIVGLKSQSGKTTKTPFIYSNHIDEFNSIFDAAALGQFLGGIDPRNGNSKPGFINESCLFNPSLLNFSWEKDNHNRDIPHATFANKKYKINTLHIHSKKLGNFVS
ncbi:MAG: hypothetical protein UR12_C0013G0002 [candidate division TM6 bacterium GW2011_GWF2_30_66]|nr:MAG: hypothetical protein UR12_C0013G0002 [candidate division TM6 bacterium GW2011_GWF2_30_66]